MVTAMTFYKIWIATDFVLVWKGAAMQQTCGPVVAEHCITVQQLKGSTPSVVQDFVFCQ